MSLQTVSEFPEEIVEIENMQIPLSDGCVLAARVWMPIRARSAPVPAILEYLPYRKRSGTYWRDALTHPYLAGHGYACVRVDMRGCGESDGLLLDEYLKQEQDDCVEVIAWLAQQAWCSGNVGMMGISWGGFNSLQVAARQPPALKTIITLAFTDDRYADDIHYKGGCLMGENLGWAATMLCYQTASPDPLLLEGGVQAARERWLTRLHHQEPWAARWMRHARRDAYWRHGSVCEQYGSIRVPVLAIGGWADAYKNAVLRLVRGLQSHTVVRAVIGPWLHKYPHFAVPAPAIGFLQEALRWFDQWLKGRECGVLADPLLRIYMQHHAPARAWLDTRPGRWIAESTWPSPNVAMVPARLLPSGRLLMSPFTDRQEAELSAGYPAAVAVPSVQSCGQASGEYCAMWLGPELPGDQRPDDALSALWDSAPLTAPLQLLGTGELVLQVCADAPVALLCARLCDVDAAGSARVSLGLLNLTHRDSHEAPTPLVPGQWTRVRLLLDDVAYQFEPGHRLRLALSSSYWPFVWPSPTPVRLQVRCDDAVLLLPVRSEPPAEAVPVRFPPPEAAPPAALETLRAPAHSRRVTVDLASGEQVLCIHDDFGADRLLPHGLVVDEACEERYVIRSDDPLSARVHIRWTLEMRRDAAGAGGAGGGADTGAAGGDAAAAVAAPWRIRSETESDMWCDAQNMFLRSRVRALEGEDQREVWAREWHDTVPRDLY